jgi:hypothetical protein
MKISFDLDGTLFGIHSDKLVQIYKTSLANGDEVGILTGRTPLHRESSIETLKRIGITYWDFWYDAEYMNPSEVALVTMDIMTMKPSQREGVHRYKVRMIRETGIDEHYDDETRWMVIYDSTLPAVDVTKWGGEPGVNIIHHKAV